MPRFPRNAVSSHIKWIEDVSKLEGVTVSYPIIADATGEVSKLVSSVEWVSLSGAVVSERSPVFSLHSARFYPSLSGRHGQRAVHSPWRAHRRSAWHTAAEHDVPNHHG